MVQAYRDERRRQEDAAEAASMGYATEWSAYVERHPLVTFGQWLRWQSGRRALAA